jgi:hypothetical protein
LHFLGLDLLFYDGPFIGGDIISFNVGTQLFIFIPSTEIENVFIIKLRAAASADGVVKGFQLKALVGECVKSLARRGSF